MMKQITKRRTCAQRLFPISITPFRKGVANRFYVTGPFRRSLYHRVPYFVKSCRLWAVFIFVPSALAISGGFWYNRHRKTKYATAHRCWNTRGPAQVNRPPTQRHSPHRTGIIQHFFLSFKHSFPCCSLLLCVHALGHCPWRCVG